MSDQLSMFRQPLQDPAGEQVGRYHRDGTDTERAAARRVAPRSGTQRYAVLAALRYSDGMTDFEVWRAINEYTTIRCAYPHVAGTRREELIADGWPIIDSGERRPTDTGAKAIVWRLEA